MNNDKVDVNDKLDKVEGSFNLIWIHLKLCPYHPQHTTGNQVLYSNLEVFLRQKLLVIIYGKFWYF